MNNIRSTIDRGRRARDLTSTKSGAVLPLVRSVIRRLVRPTAKVVWRRLPQRARTPIWSLYVRLLSPANRSQAPVSPTEWSWPLLAVDGQSIAFPPDDLASETLVESLRHHPAAAKSWVIVLAPIDWGFRRQRPHKIAEGLAALGFGVIYVDPTIVNAPSSGLELTLVGANTYSARLSASGIGSAYDSVPSGERADRVVAAVADLRARLGILDAWVAVMLPFWTDIALTLRSRFGWRVWYDRMDLWSGFERVGEAYGRAETRLLSAMDVGTATAAKLIEQPTRQTLVPNACDDLFLALAPVTAGSGHGRRVGYVGAIAEWFDIDMILAISNIGGIEIALYGAVSQDLDCTALKGIRSVTFYGEIPHSQVPGVIDGFDVCVLPFLERPLTASTDPVKVYEYLARGKPVVASNLPELARFDSLICRAMFKSQFVDGVEKALVAAAGDDTDEQRKRRDSVRGHTWSERARTIGELLKFVPPRVSVVILNWNNARLTAASIMSLLQTSTYSDLEVICVDNGSEPDDRTTLDRLLRGVDGIVHVRNAENLGFAGGMNSGVRASTGDVLILLNNDAFLGPGGIEGIESRLRDPRIGLVGPVTNWTGNEAKIDSSPSTFGEFLRTCSRRRIEHAGGVSTTRNLAFFCVALTRSTWTRVGELDDSFGIGMFEDDDYCRRVRALGLELCILEDVFVYHVGEASFSALREDGSYAKLFSANRQVFETKWGTVWEPHSHLGAEFITRPFPT